MKTHSWFRWFQRDSEKIEVLFKIEKETLYYLSALHSRPVKSRDAHSRNQIASAPNKVRIQAIEPP
ncbi:hypothetical protein AYM17_02765 [Coxiella burnetii]|nr:hypothetical protein CbuG_0588 [Coxiella burnetii CbuG_Q212]ATN66410.1 hypothetical protein AYM17_02765 [Coxiella burnetii]